ncbi:HK97 gp10 family phage protein [Listeria monocytogenes]|nr:HK97 gp10 family phage protein [Listeria monocytogenes]
MKIQGLNIAIADALKTYTKDVEKDLEVVQKKVAINAAKKLQQRSPVKKGRYARGWKAKKTATGYVIYNASDPGKTHLLENGHAKRGGGRVKAYKHIEPVEQEAIQEYVREAERALRQ